MGKFSIDVQTSAGDQAKVSITTRDGCVFSFDSDCDSLNKTLFALINKMGERPPEHRAAGKKEG